MVFVTSLTLSRVSVDFAALRILSDVLTGLVFQLARLIFRRGAAESLYDPVAAPTLVHDMDADCA